MERIVLYARVSSELQSKNHTIVEQVYQATLWAKTNNLAIQAEYLDDAQSGMLPLSFRPGGKQLLADAAQKKFDAVLVYALDHDILESPHRTSHKING